MEQEKINPQASWITMFFKNSGGISSKRVISLICVLTCLVIFVWGFISGKEIPDYGEIIFIGSLSLYGVEMLPNWSKSINK